MNVEYAIKLDTIEKVKKFVSIVDKFENDIDIISGRYLVNGKSLLALFSLDLFKPLKVVVRDVTMQETLKYQKIMEEFGANEL